MKNYNPTISGLPEMSYLSFNNPGLQPWAVKICFFRDIMASKRRDQISMPQGKINIHDFLPLSLALKGRDILAQAEGLGLGECVYPALVTEGDNRTGVELADYPVKAVKGREVNNRVAQGIVHREGGIDREDDIGGVARDDGREYGIEDMRAAGARLVPYRVQRAAYGYTLDDGEDGIPRTIPGEPVQGDDAALYGDCV